MNPFELEEAVGAGIEAGYSARRIAAELGVERGRVDRCVARLKKTKRAAEATEQERADPSTIAKLIDGVDEQLRGAIAAGNDQRAKRLIGVRAGLVGQLPPPAERDSDGVDYSVLSETEFSALGALIAKINHVEPDDAGRWWAECFARIPAHVEGLHPAHVPISDGAPEGVKLLVP
jgi:hypothetical protein